MVGAVVSKNGKIIGEGYHAGFGKLHAEIEALKDVVAKGNDPDDATMYVTLEPCAHEGKTPPCAPEIVEAGLSRVIIATEDPLWAYHAHRESGDIEKRRGIEVLSQNGVETACGLCSGKALMLNAPFFKRFAEDLPLVTAKWAMSVDGKIATRTGESKWISGPESRRIVHEIRGQVDAVIIGSSTAIQDDPMLNCRDAETRREALRVVLCGNTLPPRECRLVQTARELPVLIVTTCKRTEEELAYLRGAGCEVLQVAPSPSGANTVDLRGMLEHLAGRGASRVMVEGGREVFGSFFDGELVDEAVIFIAPIVIGGRDAVTAVGGIGDETVEESMSLLGPILTDEELGDLPAKPCVSIQSVGPDILVRGWVKDPRQWFNGKTG